MILVSKRINNHLNINVVHQITPDNVNQHDVYVEMLYRVFVISNAILINKIVKSQTNLKKS
jgi:hypothetical protein